MTKFIISMKYIFTNINNVTKLNWKFSVVKEKSKAQMEVKLILLKESMLLQKESDCVAYMLVN